MKQKCQLQIGVTQHENAATPLSTSGINTTRQHFQMRYITLFYLRWGSIISIFVFELGFIHIFMGWGFNQEWGFNGADTVCSFIIFN